MFFSEADMDPLNYSIQAANPFDSVLKGVQAGFGIRQGQQQQQLAQAELQAFQAKQQQQAQKNATIQALINNPNPTADDYARATLQVPELREQFKDAWDRQSTEQKANKLSELSQWSAAIQNGRPEIVVNAMNKQADSLEEAAGGPTPESQALRANAGVVQENPQFANNAIIKPMIFAHPDGKNVISNLTAINQDQRAAELQPGLVRKGVADAAGAEADAITKGVEARYADTEKLLQLEGIRTDNQFKKDQTKIGYLNAQIARENNGVQRQKLELELQKAQSEFGDKARAKIADVEAAAGNIDNMLNTIKRIENNPSLNSVLGSLEGKDYYPNTLLGTINPFGDGDERADAIKLIDTLGSQAFLSQIPNIKGMGALSNTEGEKLQAAFQNLSRAQSEKQFRASLNEATRLLNKGRATVEKRYGIQLGNPDTPAAASGRPPLSSFYTAPGG